MIGSVIHLVACWLATTAMVGQAVAGPVLISLCKCVSSGQVCACLLGQGECGSSLGGCCFPRELPRCEAASCEAHPDDACCKDALRLPVSSSPCGCMLLPRHEQAVAISRPGELKPKADTPPVLAAAVWPTLDGVASIPLGEGDTDIPRPKLQCLLCVWRN
jgi:hypothetical protein